MVSGLLLLAYSLPCWPENSNERRDYKITINPPEAQAELTCEGVKQNGPLLVGSGSFSIQRPPYSGSKTRDQQQLKFTIRASGYHDRSFLVTWGKTPDDPTKPVVLPDIELEATSMTWSKQHWWLFVGMGLVAAGGVGYAIHLNRKHKSKSERMTQIETLTAAADHRDPYINTLLGKYRLVQRLGQGGMAWVYKGVPDENLNSEDAVAIKIIKPDVASDDFKVRFNREIQVSMKLNHPNVLRVIDWGLQDDLHYLVMELVDGKPLDDFIPGGGAPVATVVEWLPSLIESLAYAHDLGIVHRDLKPENVMMTSKGRIKLMDFGLARNREVKTVTVTGSAMGTPGYMAPEQITLGPGGDMLSALSDQYSFGVMVFQMLCGRLPFVYDEPIKQVMAHLTEPCPSILQFRSDLPKAVDNVLQKMLAKDRDRRYANVREAGQALMESLTGVPWTPSSPKGSTPPRGVPVPAGEANLPRPSQDVVTPAAVSESSGLITALAGHQEPVPDTGDQPTTLVDSGQVAVIAANELMVSAEFAQAESFELEKALNNLKMPPPALPPSAPATPVEDTTAPQVPDQNDAEAVDLEQAARTRRIVMPPRPKSEG